MPFKCRHGKHVRQRILYRIQKSQVVVFVHWVPSKMQPADPLSRVLSNCGGERRTANARAWRIYGQLRLRLEVAQYMGVLGMPVLMKAMQLSASKNVLREPGGRGRT